MSQFFLEKLIVTHEKILVPSYSFGIFIGVYWFEHCYLNFFHIGCFLMYNYLKLNLNLISKVKLPETFSSFLYAAMIWISQSTVLIHIETWIFLACYRYMFALLYKTKTVILAYEIKFQFKCTNLFISKYTSQHTVKENFKLKCYI